MQLAKLVESAQNVLLVTAIWPKRKQSYFYKFRTFFTLTLSVLLCFCMFINVGYNTQNFLILSKSLYLTMAVLCGVTKEIVLVFKGTEFSKLLDMFDCFSFTNYLSRYNMEYKKYLNIITMVSQFFRIQVIGCLIGMTLFPVMEQQSLPIDFPFFNNGSFHYPFYIFQMVSVSIVAYHNLTVDLLITGIFAVAAIQLRVLNSKLKDTNNNVKKIEGYSEETKEQHTFEYLKECCIHFSDIERFIVDSVGVFSVIFIIQLGAFSIAVCNAGIIILSTNFVSIEAASLFFYVIALFIEIGLYCWFGNEIYFESEEINNACYMSKWYDYGPNVRKTMFILMERTKRPLEIKAVNFVTLSFKTFLTMIKWSYSYFTLLRNFTDKQGQRTEN